MRTFAKMAIWGAALTLWPATHTVAQKFYDDDIYGVSKAKTVQKKEQKTVEKGYAPADTYVPVYGTGSTRNVDEYNRRGSYKPVKQTTMPDSLAESFEYTRRIERFSNPDVVTASNDPELEYYYYNASDELAEATQTVPATINIYVENTDPWDYWWGPYYYRSAWSWATYPHYYNPWWSYNYWWGPSYGWSWGWTGGWTPGWGWNAGWNWGWGPSWGWNPPHHHPGGPSWGHGPAVPNRRPQTPGAWTSGARPNAATPQTGRRPSTAGSNHQPAVGNSGSSSSTNRGSWRTPYNPSNSNRVGNTSTSTSTNRGSSSTGTRTSGWNNGSTRSSSSTNWNTNSSTTRSSSSNRSSSGSSFGSSSSRSSGGSYGGGSYGGSSSSGRSSSGGGRGGRH